MTKHDISCGITNINTDTICKTLNGSLNNDANIIFFAGHTVGYYSETKNNFLSIVPPYSDAYSKEISKLLNIYDTPIETLEITLKYMQDYPKSKVFILLNDISYLSTSKSKKIVYRNKLIEDFSGSKGLPDSYIELFNKYQINTDRIIKLDNKYFSLESNLLDNFSKRVSTLNDEKLTNYKNQCRCSLITLEMTLQIFNIKNNSEYDTFVLFHPYVCTDFITHGLDYYNDNYAQKKFNYIVFPYNNSLKSS